MSRMLRALAMLGGIGMGVTKELDAQEDRQEAKARRAKADERQAKNDAWMDEQRDRSRADWARQDAERAALDEASSTEVKDGTSYQPAVDDEGYAMPANPTAGTFKVGGQRFATQEEATKAANDPLARSQRMAGAVARFNPERAQAIETTGMQAEQARMQMRQAKLAEANDAYNRQLLDLPAQDWGTLEKFVSDSKGDGQGGALKVKFVPSADGKTMTAHRVNPDGTTTVTPWTFGNTQDGFQTAVGVIGMKLAPEQKLAHMQGMAKTAEERKRWELTFDAQRTDADRNFKLAENRDARATAHEARMAAAAERTARAAESKATADDKPVGVNMGDADKFINGLFTKKDEMTGATTFDPLGAQAVRGLMLRMPAAQAGDTQGAVNQALTIYQQALKVAGGDHGKAMAAIEKATAPRPAPAAAPAAAVSQAPAGPVWVASSGPAVPRMQTAAAPQTTLGQIEQEQRAQLAQADAALAQAQAMLAAVGRSGDQASIQRYTQEVTKAAAARNAVAARMGNAAR